MPEPLILALDQGTSSSRSVLFDRDGVQRSATFLLADSFEFMPRAKREANEEAPKTGQRIEAASSDGLGDGSGDEADTIPF